MIKAIQVIKDYRIKQLTKADYAIVKKLCEKCSDYYLMSGGTLITEDGINEIFNELPPNKRMEDKFLLGVFSDNDLIGLIDIVRGYPSDEEWMLGLLLLEPKQRGHGLGRNIHVALMNWAKDQKAKTFRIGVIATNNRALNFWERLGYKKIDQVSMDIVSKTHVVYVMRLFIENT